MTGKSRSVRISLVIGTCDEISLSYRETNVDTNSANDLAAMSLFRVTRI